MTTKERPGDFDLVWGTDGVDISALDGVLVNDLSAPRATQHQKYGGDILPNVIEGRSGMPFIDFFQQDVTTGKERGIVEIDLIDLGDFR